MSATCLESRMAGYDIGKRKMQRGFALMSAIFLLVIMAVLGAAMLILSSVQHATSSQDVQGSRAYQAARAGIEWGVYQVLNPENTNFPEGPAFTTQYNCVGIPAPFVFASGTPTALGGTLSGFDVAVTCARQQFDEGGRRISVYTLTSTATTGAIGGTDHVNRQISVMVSTCRRTNDGEPCEQN